MAWIQERKDSKGRIKYTALVRLRGYPPQSATFERKTDAQRWVQATESAIREGRHFKGVEAKKHTLKELVERYKRDVLPQRQDQQKSDMHLDWWVEQLGAFLLADITHILLAEQRDKLQGTKTKRGTPRAPATVNRYIAALSVVLSKGIEWGWLEDNPFRKVKKLKEPRGRVRFLSPEERETLLTECKKSRSPHLYVIVVLALSTGARWSEIVNLTWKEVDLPHRVIRLEHTKNGERRTIPLTGLALKLIQEKNKVRRIDSLYVFPSKDGKKPADLRDAWDLAVERSKIEDFRFHDLRHTAASYLAMNGASLMEISDILGHKTLAMVKRYAHLAEQHTRGILEKMNEQQFNV